MYPFLGDPLGNHGPQCEYAIRLLVVETPGLYEEEACDGNDGHQPATSTFKA